MSGRVVIVDYGMGNIESVHNAFSRLQVDCLVTKDPKQLSAAKAVILPGVGAFNAAMKNLLASGFVNALHEEILDKNKPFLGICLGMQLIAESSTELTYTEGLKWIPGHVIKMDFEPSYPVPHVGWNEITIKKNTNFFKNIDDGAHFYFDHSFHLECDPDVIVATCEYGNKNIVASIQQKNIFAMQFHPEKSQRNGLKILRNFLNYI